MATRESWTVIVCKPSTESPWVKIWIDDAAAPNHNNKELLVQWNAGDATPDWAEYDVPAKWHPYGKIWIYAHGVHDQEVHMAVTYRGDTKQVMDFNDGNGEEHEISKTGENKDFKCPK